MTNAEKRADSSVAPPPGSDRRQKIIEAATKAIEEFGPDAAIGVTADLAGLPRPHIYRHFDSKAELDQAVARHAARLLGRRVRPTLSASGSPVGIIRAASHEVVAWASAHPNLYRFRALRRDAPAVQEYGRAAAAYLQRLGHDAVFPAQVVAAVVGLADASVLWWLDNPDQLTDDELVDKLTRQVWLLVEQAVRDLGIDAEPDR
ncbi:MAG: TetR/AcrR family transcriptional regulator [Nocardiaceae bacterium]|nr:TetR/AcrR family transcriptional regulator [Nocardiaceae bacterium]